MKFLRTTGGVPEEVFDNNPEVPDPQMLDALERARKADVSVCYGMLDSAIPRLQQLVDAYRFHGGSPTEVDRALLEVTVLVRDILSR